MERKELKSEKREKLKKNKRKMIVNGFGVFELLRIIRKKKKID